MRDEWNFGQQKRGWTRRPLNRDRYPSAAAGYTRHCCSSGDPRRARRISGREILPDPSPKRSIRAGVTDVRLSCVAYREPLRTHAKPAGRYHALAEGWYSLSRALEVAGAQLAGFSPLRLPLTRRLTRRLGVQSRVNVVPIRAKSMPMSRVCNSVRRRVRAHRYAVIAGRSGRTSTARVTPLGVHTRRTSAAPRHQPIPTRPRPP